MSVTLSDRDEDSWKSNQQVGRGKAQAWQGTLSSQGSFLAIWLGGWPCRDRASFPGTNLGFRLL